MLRQHPLGELDRNSAPVVAHLHRFVIVNHHLDTLAEARQMLVD
jgi:hypothetical protein